jgi:transcriptional regulator with XRE-family HTH domain
VRVFSFGERLALLRKGAGLTQTELAEKLGISRRMIAYYEGETKYPPTTILPRLAQTLGVTTDELLDSANACTRRPKPTDVRLQRAFHQVEQLSARERSQAMRLLNSFIQRKAPVRNV